MSTSTPRLADLDSQVRASHQRKPCGLVKVMRELDPEDLAVLQRWLEDENLMHSRIRDALIGYGHAIGSDTVSRHRRGVCSC